jgi:hypothetical protein
MRPERDNIAAPDLPEGLAWIGTAPRSMPAATAAGPVLVHFLDFAQLNSVRSLPYVSEWARRYRENGLTTIGVQGPRFPFGADRDVVADGLERLDIDFPVAIDADRRLWHAYGCEGWPSLFLWKLGGALAWFHFGEGEYRATEEAIQAELRESDALLDLPTPMQPLRPTDAAGAKVMPPTPELFPGGDWEHPWTADRDSASLEIPYEAAGAHTTVEGQGQLHITLDGTELPPLPIEAPAIYTLAEHPRHERHRLTLQATPGLRVWSLSFPPGIP